MEATVPVLLLLFLLTPTTAAVTAGAETVLQRLCTERGQRTRNGRRLTAHQRPNAPVQRRGPNRHGKYGGRRQPHGAAGPWQCPRRSLQGGGGKKSKRQGRAASASPSNTYAPTLFASHPHSEGTTKRALTDAMNRLLAAKSTASRQPGQGRWNAPLEDGAHRFESGSAERGSTPHS
jgi:hypothetical protein